MNTKKNAFTLIELLAIIVILAIIAVITIPILLNVIENSRKGTATDSAYGYKDSVNKAYIAELQNHNKLKLDGTYTVKSDGSLEPTEDNEFGFGDSEYGNSLDVAVSGTIPSSGKLRYSNNVLNAGCVVIGEYEIIFTDSKITDTKKGDCSDYEFPNNSGQTWNNYITPTQQSGGSSLPNGSNIWIQENTITNDREVCSIYDNGTICLVSSTTGYNSDFADCSSDISENYDGTSTTCIKGYAKSKADEMLFKGAAEVYIYDDGIPEIYSWSEINGNSCSINKNGSVSCYNHPYYCTINTDGSRNCIG